MKKRWILLSVFAVIIFLVIKTLYVAGSFKTIRPHMEGNLHTTYYGIPGPEDMDLDDSTGLLFISSNFSVHPVNMTIGANNSITLLHHLINNVF
jgi:hypothetical protein